MPSYKAVRDEHFHNLRNQGIALKPGFVVFAVMVFVQAPQETMHNIFMRKPRHKFHHKKGKHKNQYINPHNYIFKQS